MFNFIENQLNKLMGFGWGSSSLKKELLSYRKLVDNNKIFIDVGGNKGLYSEEILNLYKPSELHIFEPSVFNFKILKNRFENLNNVYINNFGLSSSNKNVNLYSEKIGSGLASLNRRRLDHFGINFSIQEKIEVKRFDSYWLDKGNSVIDLFKIDVEGHELDVIDGIGSIINNIKIIQFEFGGCNIDSRTYFQDYWYLFQNLNFELYRISPFGPIKITKYHEGLEKFITTNYFCLNRKFFH